MPAHTRCNLCECPGTLADATDVARVACNVRHFKDDVFTLWRCRNCGTIHCAEEVDLAHYYAHYPLKKQKLDFHERAGFRNRLKFLQKLGLKRGDRILDYGCGPGLFVKFLRDCGYDRAAGYDPFETAFSDAKVLQDPADVLVNYDVIEHDDDPRAFLKRVAALVKPGGLLAIGTPNAENVSLARAANPALHAPYHRHILTSRTLLALGRELDLEPQRVQMRSYFDTLIPTVNSRFMWSYLEKCGQLDAAFEPPRTGLVLTSPSLIFNAFFGYFAPVGDNMIVSFRKAPVVAMA
jgi:SAM-dependent methyltransferase